MHRCRFILSRRYYGVRVQHIGVMYRCDCGKSHLVWEKA